MKTNVFLYLRIKQICVLCLLIFSILTGVCVRACVHTRSVPQSCLTLWTPWTGAHQASRSMGFSREGCWRALPFPPPGTLPTQESNPCLCVSCTAGVSFTSEPLGKPFFTSGPSQLQFSIVNEETALSLCANGLNPEEKNLRILKILECNKYYTWKKKKSKDFHIPAVFTWRIKWSNRPLFQFQQKI